MQTKKNVGHRDATTFCIVGLFREILTLQELPQSYLLQYMLPQMKHTVQSVRVRSPDACRIYADNHNY